jgi:hypothetical protein
MQTCKELPDETYTGFKALRACLRINSKKNLVFKTKNKKEKKQKIYSAPYLYAKHSLAIENSFISLSTKNVSYKCLETYFKYKEFSFFDANKLDRICKYGNALSIANRFLSSVFKLSWSGNKVELKNVGNLVSEWKKEGLLYFFEQNRSLSKITVRFIPASPQKSFKHIHGVNVVNIPIAANWFKNIYLKGLAVCGLFSGFQKEDYLVTHIINHVHTEPMEGNQIDIYEGWVLLATKEKLDVSETGVCLRKNIYRPDPNEVANGLRSVRVLLVKLASNNFCYGLNYPDTSKIDLSSFVKTTVQKVKGLIASETLALITKEKPPTFRSLFRGLSPVPFDTDCSEEIASTVPAKELVATL